MDLLLLFLVFVAAALVAPRLVRPERAHATTIRRGIQLVSGVLALFCVAATSFVMIPADRAAASAAGVLSHGHLDPGMQQALRDGSSRQPDQGPHRCGVIAPWSSPPRKPCGTPVGSIDGRVSS